MSSASEDNQRIEPIVILPPGAMSADDMQRLRDNGICVVEAEDPSAVRFMEPPPVGYELADLAAIELFRWWSQTRGLLSWQEGCSHYTQILLRGLKMRTVEAITTVAKKSSRGGK